MNSKRTEPVHSSDLSHGRVKLSFYAGSGCIQRLVSIIQRRTGQKELLFFTRQLETMVLAGLPLVSGMKILNHQKFQGRLNQVIQQITSSLEDGNSLSDACSCSHNVFDKFYLSLLRVSEMSGKLDLVLHQLVNYLEKSIKLQRGLITALIYPLVVIITTIVVCATLLIFVIPTFSELFYEVGAELPLSTRTVIYLGNFCQSSLPWLLATFISVVVGGLFAGTTSRGVELYLGFMLKLPSVGGFLRRVTAARFLRNLAIMLASGVAIVDGLAVCAETLSFPRSKTFMDRATGDLCEGRTLSEALSHLPFLSPLSLQMLAIGESTGSSDVIVDKLAEMYETEIESYISALKQLIEPILILFIAGFVGAIVFAMYAPIFSLGGVMGQS